MFSRTRIATLLALIALVLPFGAIAADPAPRTVRITAGDDMKFGVDEIKAKPGEQLRIVLISRGTMPKVAMAHNVVVLAKGTDVTAFVNASAMARDDGFVGLRSKRACLRRRRSPEMVKPSR